MSKVRIADFLGPAEYRRIAVSVLQPNPHQPRKHFDAKSLAQLAGSIAEGDQIQPIMVVEVVRGSRSTMYIAVGERRVRAHRLLNRPTIQAMVRRLKNNDELDRVMSWYGLAENLDRDNLNPVEQGQAFAEIMQRESLNQAQVAEICHVHQTQVSVCLGVLELAQTAKDAIASGFLNPSVFVTAVRLFSVPKRLQQKMVRAATKGGRRTLEEQREAVENVLVAADLQKASGESSTRAIAIRKIRRLIETLEKARGDAFEVKLQERSGLIRIALVQKTQGDRMILGNILDQHERAIALLRATIKEMRG